MQTTVDSWKRTASLARSITERANTSGELAVSEALKLARDVASSEQSVIAALGYVCTGVKGEGPHAKIVKTSAKVAKVTKKQAPKHASTPAAKPAAKAKKKAHRAR